jgi:hypothetical protein
MLIHLSIPSKNSLPSLDEAWRLFISSGDHTEVSSNSLADVINGFWQFTMSCSVALRSCSNSSAPLDMQRANLDGQNLCSQIYGRDWIPEPPCHSIFKRRGGGGGVQNWACISRVARIKAPRSMTLKRFRTPFAILPLIKGGGGVRNGGVSRKGPIPVVSPFVSFSSPPVICSPPDRAPRLIPFSPSLSSDICPSPNYQNSEVV